MSSDLSVVDNSPNDVLAPSFHLGYRPALDGLRAVSILLVLCVHLSLLAPGLAWLLPTGGFLGVDVFFVISGYLITSLLLAEHQTTGDISLTAFYWRRALRLFPALATLLLFACALAGLVGSFSALGLTPIRFTSTIAYFTNWVRAYEGPDAWLLFHFWSLSVEEQFYLIWPALVLLMLRLQLKPRTIIAITVAAIAASTILKPVLFLTGSPVNRIYYGSDTRADAVLIGCLLSLLLHFGYIQQTSRVKEIAASCARGGVILLAAFVCLADDGFQPLYLGGLTAVAIAVACVLLHVTLTPEGRAAKMLSTPGLLWIGRRSYGLYLWHWPIYFIAWSWLPAALVVPVALAATFLVAALSFTFVEQPFLQRKNVHRNATTSLLLRGHCPG